jgi:hypothetical protein
MNRLHTHSQFRARVLRHLLGFLTLSVFLASCGGGDGSSPGGAAASLPDLSPSAVSTSATSVAPGGTLSLSWTISNLGEGDAPASSTSLRLLSESTAGTGGVENSLITVSTNAIAAGSNATQTQSLTIPVGTPVGSYVIVIALDSSRLISQSNPNNDNARSNTFKVVGSVGFSGKSVIPGTGVSASQCFAAGGNALVSCTSPAAIALNPKQDGMGAANSLDFSVVDAYPLTDCVRDNKTGLIWEGKPTDGVRSFANRYKFNDKIPSINVGLTAVYETDVKNALLCGFSDWRMPEIYELMTLVDYSIAFSSQAPRLSVTWFPNSKTNYWSGTADAQGSIGWTFSVTDGATFATISQAADQPVRLVRGSLYATPAIRFTINSAGDEVLDNKTGLTWARCQVGLTWSGSTCSGSASVMTHEAALTYAAGQGAWRLPNVKELITIIDYTKFTPAMDSSVFSSPPLDRQIYTWSSTPHVRPGASASEALSVGFSIGNVAPAPRSGLGYVRLVR